MQDTHQRTSSRHFLRAIWLRTLPLCVRLWRAVKAPVEYILLAVAVRRNARPARPGTLILLCRYRFYVEESAEPSTEYIHLDRTLEQSGRGIALHFWEDTRRAAFKDADFFRKVSNANPAILVLSSYSPDAHGFPSVSALATVKQHLGVPLVALWWDTCSSTFAESVRPVVKLADLHVVMDNPLMKQLSPQLFGDLHERFVCLWVPCEPDLYRLDRQRDIPVSFLGQVSSYRDYRSSALEALERAQLGFFCSARDRLKQPSYSEYVEFLNRSKIGVNFSFSVDSHQLKARVFEILLSGALLLESENPQIACLFEEGRDYVAFRDEGELVDKTRYYLAHENERREIAERGRDKAARLYSGQAFWSRIFEKLAA